MKLIVIGSEQKPPEKEFRLKLVQCGNEATLMAVDEKGERLPCGNLITVRTCGDHVVFVACDSISRELPVVLNGVGKLVVE